MGGLKPTVKITQNITPMILKTIDYCLKSSEQAVSQLYSGPVNLIQDKQNGKIISILGCPTYIHFFV